MLSKQAIERVRAFRKASGWTLSKFAREAGLKESTIRKMDQDDWNPEFRTIEKLEKAMNAELDRQQPTQAAE